MLLVGKVYIILVQYSQVSALVKKFFKVTNSKSNAFHSLFVSCKRLIIIFGLCAKSFTCILRMISVHYVPEEKQVRT